MTNITKWKNILVPILVLLILDFLWIGIFMGPMYGQMIYKIQNEQIKLNYLSAILAYVCMCTILIYIIIKNNLSLSESFLLGLCLYGVYDFTAGAIFKNWNWPLAIIDIVWGGFVFFAANYSYHLIRS